MTNEELINHIVTYGDKVYGKQPDEAALRNYLTGISNITDAVKARLDNIAPLILDELSYTATHPGDVLDVFELTLDWPISHSDGAMRYLMLHVLGIATGYGSATPTERLRALHLLLMREDLC